MLHRLHNFCSLLKKFSKDHLFLTCLTAGLFFLVTIISLMHYADILIYNFQPGYGAHLVGLGRHQPFYQSLIQYDSGHYIQIAKHGYTQLNDAAFMPLFPLLIRALAALHISYDAAALLAAWVPLLLLIPVLYKWLDLELSLRNIKISPWIAIFFIAIFPTAFYFAIPYTESLFLFLTVSALYTFRKGNYFLATICASLASITKYQGVTLAIYFLANFWLQKKRNYFKLLPVAGALLGIIVYMIFLKAHYGSFFEFITAQKQWGRLHGNIIINFIKSFRPEYLWYLPVLAGSLLVVLKYLGKAYFLYSLVFVLLPLSSGRLDSLNRYMVCTVPIFLALSILYSKYQSNGYWVIYLGGSFFLAAWNIMLFANGYLVA